MSGKQHHSTVARYIEDASSPDWYSNMPVGALTPDFVEYFNDFINTGDYAATNWTITTTEDGAGSATEALGSDALNGTLVITNDNGGSDSDSLQQNEETWKLTSGKKMWFDCRFAMGDADSSTVFVGLAVTDTTPLDTTDRIGFQVDGDASIDCLSEKDSTQTTTDSAVDAADATFNRCGFYWDGSSSVYFFVDGALVATHSANIPDDENLSITMHIANGTTAAETLTIDYIRVLMER